MKFPTLLLLLCIAGSGFFCASAAESVPQMKSRWPDLLHKFELTQSLSGTARAANSTGTLSAKEQYINFVTSDSVTFGEDYAVSATLKGTLALTNGNGSKVTGDTVFHFTAGTYSTMFTVGDDDNFTGKKMKAASQPETVEVTFADKDKKIKTSLTLTWKSDSLKYTIVTAGDADTGTGAVFAALKKTPSSDLLVPKPVAVPVTVPVTVSFGPDSAAFTISGTGKVLADDVNEGLPNNGSKIVHTVDYTASAK